MQFDSFDSNGRGRTKWESDKVLRKRKNPYKAPMANGYFWSICSSTIPYSFWDTIPDEAYILCVQYSKSPFDIQIGITGNFKPGEESADAVVREIEEELGLSPDGERQLEYEEFPTRKKRWIWCLGDSSLFVAAENVPLVDSADDNTNRKLGVLLWTTNPDDLLNVLNTSATQGGLDQLARDDIQAIVLVPKNIARNRAYLR